MFVFKKKSIVPFIFALFLLVGCGKDPQPADVTINLKTFVKNEEAVKYDIQYPMAVGYTYSLEKLRYYLTRIELVEDDGSAVELKKAHLFDLTDPVTSSILATSVPAGDYKAMRFVFGITKDDNVTTFLENTVANNNMAWPSQLGPGAYHYMKFEGRYINNSNDTIGYAFHLGPTFGADYSISVDEPIDLTIDGSERSLTIKMDLDKWFHDPNDYDFADWGPGIMNKTAAQEIAHANGHNVFSVVVD